MDFNNSFSVLLGAICLLSIIMPGTAIQNPNPSIICNSVGIMAHPNPSKYIRCIQIGKNIFGYVFTCPPVADQFNLATSKCESAGPSSTTMLSTIADTTATAITTQEMSTQEMTTDGMTTNGMTTNGMTTDGMTTDGMTTDGMTTDGMTTSELSTTT